MSTSLVVSKAAVAGGYALGAVLAGIVAALVTIASSASGTSSSLQEHERLTASRFEQLARGDSSVIGELRKQTCILVAETRQEKRDCLRRAFVGQP